MSFKKGIENIGQRLGMMGEGFSYLKSRVFSLFEGRKRKTREEAYTHDRSASALKTRISLFLEKIDTLADRFFHRFPQEKRRSMFIASASLAALLIILLITVLVANVTRPKKDPSTDMRAGPQIPAEELFLPGEPDFLPEYVLEREPRTSWTLEEIRPYWNNPGSSTQGSSKIWQDEIKTTVDKLMEAVP